MPKLGKGTDTHFSGIRDDGSESDDIAKGQDRTVDAIYDLLAKSAENAPRDEYVTRPEDDTTPVSTGEEAAPTVAGTDTPGVSEAPPTPVPAAAGEWAAMARRTGETHQPPAAESPMGRFAQGRMNFFGNPTQPPNYFGTGGRAAP